MRDSDTKAAKVGSKFWASEGFLEGGEVVHQQREIHGVYTCSRMSSDWKPLMQSCINLHACYHAGDQAMIQRSAIPVLGQTYRSGSVEVALAIPEAVNAALCSAGLRLWEMGLPTTPYTWKEHTIQ